jgi:heme-degrading monooxygenase HmoA
VPIEDRIAVFDNVGTLPSALPNGIQFVFAIDHGKELAARSQGRIALPRTENGHNMFVVISRAKSTKLDDEYNKVAQRLQGLALTEFGCLEFHAVKEATNEIALSYWPDQEKIRLWKNHSDHLIAQELGRKDWYESYSVQICEIKRQYHFPD